MSGDPSNVPSSDEECEAHSPVASHDRSDPVSTSTLLSNRRIIIPGPRPKSTRFLMATESDEPPSLSERIESLATPKHHKSTSTTLVIESKA